MATWQFEAAGEVAVQVSNQAGSIELVTHDGPGVEVEIVPLDDAAEELVERVRVEESGSPGQLRVLVEVPTARSSTGAGGILRRLLGAYPEVGVSIRLPHGSAVHASGGSADIRAEGSFGSFTGRSASGRIEVDRVTGEFQARTASGAVSVVSVGGDSLVETASGDVHGRSFGGAGRVTTASGQIALDAAGGRMVVKTASGDVRVGDVMAGCRVDSASGDQRLERVLAGDVHLQTVSGDLVIGVARGATVRVDAETVSGDLSSDIELAGSPGASDAPEGPRVTLRARTVSGDVRLLRTAG